MRRLILLRHAESAPSPAGRDRERALTPRGEEDARRVGGYFAAEHLLPDLVAVSDARRARDTFAALAPALPSRLPHFLEPRMYDATAETLLALARMTPAYARTLLAIGHNPGFAELAASLAGYGDRYAFQRMRNYPPGAFAVLDFDIEDWQDVWPAKGRLDRFLTPAALAGGEGRGSA